LRRAGLGLITLPPVQNGTLFLMLSPQVCAVAASLAGGNAAPARIWRLARPICPVSLAVGLAFVALS
jgi:hypothetical protein